MKTILGLFSLLILFTNCSNYRYAYSPSAHNVPIFTKQGDSKLAANYSTNGPSGLTEENSNNNQYEKNVSHGADLQGAVAVTNHIGIQANYYYRSEKRTSNYDYNFDNTVLKYKRNLLEFGAGYFTPLDKKQHMLFQVYGGAGFGKTTITDNGTDQNQNPYSRYYNTDITKFYLEPSLTFRVKEIFAASIVTRASIIKFRNVNTNYTLSEKQDYNLDSLNRYAVAFFEPAFVGSFGFNKLPGFRIELQAGLSILWEETFLDYRPANFSVGLVFDIGKLIRGPEAKASH